MVKSALLQKKFRLLRQVTGLAFLEAGNRLVSSGKDGYVKVPLTCNKAALLQPDVVNVCMNLHACTCSSLNHVEAPVVSKLMLSCIARCGSWRRSTAPRPSSATGESDGKIAVPAHPLPVAYRASCICIISFQG